MDAITEAQFKATTYIFENLTATNYGYVSRGAFEKFIDGINMRHITKAEEDSNKHLFSLEFWRSMCRCIAEYMANKNLEITLTPKNIEENGTQTR